MGKDDRIIITVPGVRAKFEEWIKDRGGVQVWNNLNLSDPDAGKKFTPAITDDDPTNQPHWSVGRGEVIKDISRFRFVKSWKEVKRFRVGVRMGSQGMSLKVTDGGTRRIRAVCARAEEQYHVPAYYHFDYKFQEAVIEVPEYEDRQGVPVEIVQPGASW